MPEGGFRLANILISELLGKDFKASVFIIPGEMVFTLICLFASSIDRYLVIDSRADLETPTEN